MFCLVFEMNVTSLGTLTRHCHKCVAISYSADQMLSVDWNIHEPYIRRLGRYWKPFSSKLNVLVTNSVTALSLPRVYSDSLAIFIPFSTLFFFCLTRKKCKLFFANIYCMKVIFWPVWAVSNELPSLKWRWI